MPSGTQDPNVVNSGDSTYNLRAPDVVAAADIPSSDMARVLPRQTSTGLARGIQQLGSPNVFVDSGNEQIIVAKSDTANTSVNQVLMGNQLYKGEGFYVTKSGIDVTTAKNDSDFVFNSNQNVFKIVQSGTISTPALNVANPGAGNFNSGTVTISQAHDLGYTPAALAYVTDDTQSQYFPAPYTTSTGSGGLAAWFTVSFIVNSEFIYSKIEGTCYGTGISQLAGTIKYYLLQETAN